MPSGHCWGFAMIDILATLLELDARGEGHTAWEFMDAIGQLGSPLPTHDTLTAILADLNPSVRHLFAVALKLDTP